MPRKYSGRGKTRRSTQTQSSSLIWVWVFLGMFLGVIGAMLAYGAYTRQWSFQSPKPQTIANAQQVQAKPTTHSVGGEQKSLPNKPNEQYEFYTLLPGMEVQVPKGSSVTPTHHLPGSSSSHSHSSNVSNASNVPSSNTPLQVGNRTLAGTPATMPLIQTENKKQTVQYILQAGIFLEPKSADELKARLILQGFTTHIQKVRTQNGQNWYRVTLGPFSSESKAFAQKKRLEKQKIKATLILQRQLQ